jgi:2,3-bisphosphoglycerate-independent phosphoglycerate mutase
MVLLRGFAQLPDWPRFPEVFGLRAAALAAYPMYRGLARMLGMEILGTPSSPQEEIARMEENYDDFDFFFVHAKPTDSAGEDGAFDRKVSAIEQVDELIPRIQDLRPDVLVVTGDHSTPSLLHYHSWHPVPVLLYSPHCRADPVRVFGERACLAGGLGPRLPATDLMPLALANAFRLAKFGA